MTAEGEAEAAEMHARAESHAAAARYPFELARIRLAHGVRVRRARGGPAARKHLASAVQAFEQLGAAGWAERARTELRAAGAVPRTSAQPPVQLTWQERRIAELAAGGLTHEEIGERTRLSPGIVSAHLYRVLPKLGITTQAALRAALKELDEAPGVRVIR
ncbi:LuxR C-terminal-related transcriptional regulator [Streptomyces sp. NPDC056160]|uniref:helix-turn-helix transcriptional regulator n=1 Tax=Streptomyces sp. NPDC056160 TaxID=3345731 RepID=UPI0035DA41C0